MRVCFYTLGCKVNLNETEALEQLFKRSGFTVVPDGEDADVYIVNSCTVTNFGAQKSRKWLRQAKRKNPGAVTVMSGCWPQASPEAAAGMTEADVVCGTTNRRAILGYVNQMLEGHERIVAIQPHERGEAFEELPVDRFETHTRAFIKVEDGCNRRCAYCVIPRARGPVRSRAEESILAELRQLAAAGYREAVDKLCPQFHLSLQSGCDATLRRMRRPYTTAQYLQVVQQLREAYGGRPVSFTTDCICGFPGETEEDFEASCAFLEQVGFLRVHVFPYSRREGTPAYSFPDQIIEEEKQARSRRMHQRAEAVRARVLAGLEGMEDEVLLETPLSGTVFTGYTRLYVPVAVSAPGCAAGSLVRVRLGRYDGTRVRAEVIRDL